MPMVHRMGPGCRRKKENLAGDFERKKTLPGNLVKEKQFGPCTAKGFDDGKISFHRTIGTGKAPVFSETHRAFSGRINPDQERGFGEAR